MPVTLMEVNRMERYLKTYTAKVPVPLADAEILKSALSMTGCEFRNKYGKDMFRKVSRNT